ncbi:MAG: aspartate aminotransferase family protein [Epsilonproteobacteria bacterium]|nr:aspartate aminotransferase family protein [Campylobacterota bacterium]
MNIEAIDKAFVMGTYARNYTSFVKGVGSKLYSDDGSEFIDFASGIGVNSVGHGNEKLVEAICNQAKKIIHISNLQVIEPQAMLAKKIVELSGYDGKVFFANSGAEANEGAIKLARKYGKETNEHKKYKIITLANSFHGRTITTVKATGQNSFHDASFAPYPDGFKFVETIADIYEAIDDETVGVMLELIQGEGGVYAFDKDEIIALRAFLDEKKLLLIVDEVQTGIYRSGEFLASNFYGITPDIITMAKGLGGGVPIGAFMSRHKDILKAGDHGSTFAGNYLSCSAGLATLEILSELYDTHKLQETIKYFDEELNELLKDFSDIFESTSGIGLMRGIKVKQEYDVGAIVKACMKHQVIILKSGRNTARFLPSLTITKDEIDEGFSRVRIALNDF